MTISRITRSVIYIASFIIGGYGLATLTNYIYLENRSIPINSNILFDGVEQIPIFIISTFVGGTMAVLLAKFILKRVSTK